MKLCKCVMYTCKYIVKNNVLSMKTEDEADAFMKPTYYHSSLLIRNQKLIIIRSMKGLIKPILQTSFIPSWHKKKKKTVVIENILLLNIITNCCDRKHIITKHYHKLL